MSDVPPGWYDDPEDPGLWRYWDGAAWTDHRSPKAARRPGRTRPVWQLVPDLFGLVGRVWRELTIVALPIVVSTMFGFVAVVMGVDQTLNVGADEFFDRVRRPGFDPANNVADEMWWDSLEFDLGGGAIALWVAGAIGFIAAAVGSIALLRFLVGAAGGRPPAPASAYVGALRRVPRVIGWALTFGAAWIAAGLVLVVAAVLSPLTLFLTIPALIVATLWAIPVVSIASSVIIVGPPATPPVRTALQLVVGRWWALAGRMLIVWLVVFAAALPLSVISGPLFATSIVGGLLVGSVNQVVQGVMGQAGGALIYLWAGGPVDPELSAESGAGIRISD